MKPDRGSGAATPMAKLLEVVEELTARNEVMSAVEAVRQATSGTLWHDTAIILSQRVHQLENDRIQGALTQEQFSARELAIARDILSAVRKWAREENGDETPAVVARTQARIRETMEAATLQGALPELLRMLGTLGQHSVGQLSLAPTPPLLTPPPPTPGAVERPTVRKAIIDALVAHSLVVVKGSSGSGRTQAALQVVNGQPSTWVRLRKLKAEDAARRIAQAAQHAAQQGHAMLVLDDVPRMSVGDELCEQLLALRGERFRCLLTTAEDLPERLRRDLGEAVSIYPLPPFSKAEVLGLLQKAGAPETELTLEKLEFFKGLTRNHPELLRMLVDYLQRRSWSYDDKTLRALLSRAFAEQTQQDVLRYLKESVTDEAARRLLYRLDLVLETIGREHVDAVAGVEPAITAPYEKLDDVRGNWVEDEAPDKWVLSPMIEGVGRKQLTPDESLQVHLRLAELILNRTSIDADDLTVAVIHLLGANDSRAGHLLVFGLASYLEQRPKHARPPPLFVNMYRDKELPEGFTAASKALIRAFHLRLDDREGRDGGRALPELVAFVRAGMDDESLAPPDVFALFVAASLAGPLRAQTDGRTAVELTRAVFHIARRLPPQAREHAPEVEKMLRAVPWLCGAALRDCDALEAWAAFLRETPREYLFPMSDIAEEGAFLIPRLVVVGEADRKHPDWGGLDAVLRALEEVGAEKEIPLVAASACAARVIMEAEYRSNVPQAREIAEKGLERYGANQSAEWILREALGMQLADARAEDEAIRELSRVIEIKVPFAGIYRARATLRLSKLLRARDPAQSVAIARQAVAYVKGEKHMSDAERVRALGELAIALAEVEGVKASYDTWSEATTLLLATPLETDADRGLFSVFGHAIGYFMGIAVSGVAPETISGGDTYVKPEAGFFLADTTRAAQVYQPGKNALLPTQLQMFAEAVGRADAVLAWGERAMEMLDATGNRNTRGLLVRTVLPFYLHRLDFDKAADTALAAGEMIAARPMPSGRPVASAAERLEWFTRENLVLPAFLKAATLRLNGAPEADAFARKLVAFCRERARVSRESSWTLAADVADRALLQSIDIAMMKGFQTRPSVVDETGLESLRRLVLTLASDCPPIRALQEQLPVFQHFFSSGRSTVPMAQLVIFPFVLSYWNRLFERSRFQFTPPKLLAQALDSARTKGGEAGVRMIFAAVLQSLSITPPVFVRDWLRSEEGGRG
jgi:hypothetical protein